MKRLGAVASLLFLAGCGKAANPSGILLEAAPNPDAIVSVTVTADYSTPDNFLQGVTFRTGRGEYSVEYCNTPLYVGDIVNLVPYGVGTTLICVNGVIVGDIIDWAATEEQIRNPDPEKERTAFDAWNDWAWAHFPAEVFN